MKIIDFKFQNLFIYLSLKSVYYL